MERLTEVHGSLLEGCLWDERSGRLYFLDIEEKRIYCRYGDGRLEEMEMPAYVSCIVKKRKGGLTAAVQDGLYDVDFDRREAQKRMDSGFSPHLRYNDGKCDPMGNLWVGTMFARQEMEGARRGGSLYCIHHHQVAGRYDGYTIPNGLDWDMDRGLFYHTETSSKVIRVYRFSRETGVLGENIRELDLSNQEGSPDGMCLDREGRLWIAMWGGYQVLVFDPESQKVLRRIPVPDENVSCCCFGGSGMDQLYITTAKNEKGQGGELYVCSVNQEGKAAYDYEGE